MTTKNSKALVAYFSHTGENYDGSTIEKGNTEQVAEEIAARMGATLFHIETVKPYSAGFKACVEESQQEKLTQARPAIKGDVAVEEYDIIFLGYPNWFADMPMALYSFIEKHAWQNKVVAPFCTHEGGGLADTPEKIAALCSGAQVLKAFEIKGQTVQTDRAAMQKALAAWLTANSLTC